jgi:hypothetical protein
MTYPYHPEPSCSADAHGTNLIADPDSDGMTVHYADKCVLVPAVPNPSKVADRLYSKFFSPLLGSPVGNNGRALTIYQFLLDWADLDPNWWSSTDPYFELKMMEGCTTWSINKDILNVLVTSIRILNHTLNRLRLLVTQFSWDSLDPGHSVNTIWEKKPIYLQDTFVKWGLEHVRDHLSYVEGMVVSPDFLAFTFASWRAHAT